MDTPSDVQRDTNAASELAAAADANMEVTANIATSNAAGAPAPEQPLIDLTASSESEGTATDSGNDAIDDGESDVGDGSDGTALGDPRGQVLTTGRVSLTKAVLHDAVIPAFPSRGQNVDTWLVQPTNLFRRLPAEVRNRIFELVLADGVAGAPGPLEGKSDKKFTRTLKMPSITMVDRQIRDETLSRFIRGKQFSVQLPRDQAKLDSLVGDQSWLMQVRRNCPPEQADSILNGLKMDAQKTEEDLVEYLQKTANLDLCPFRFVESLIVTYNGRVKLNIDAGMGNWSPRSMLIGFRCYDETGFKTWKGKDDDWRDYPNERMRLNADGKLHWGDFPAIREQYVAALKVADTYFTAVPHEELVLHPMIQHVVKALCMFATGQTKPLHWVEVIGQEFRPIPEGMGVEWSYLTYEEANYQSDPGDEFDLYAKDWLSSDEDGSQNRSEDEQEDEDEEDDDGDKSDDAENSEVGDGPASQTNVGSDELEGDHANQTGVGKTLEEARENPAGGDELEANIVSEGNDDPEAQPEES